MQELREKDQYIIFPVIRANTYLAGLFVFQIIKDKQCDTYPGKGNAQGRGLTSIKLEENIGLRTEIGRQVDL